MAITWPDKFDSRPLREGFEYARGSRLRRTNQPDAGPAKIRRMAGKRPDQISGTWLFDDYAAMQDFMSWIDDTLLGGLYAFDWTHPLTKRVLRCRIMPASDERLYIIRPFKNSSIWEITLTLEVLP